MHSRLFFAVVIIICIFSAPNAPAQDTESTLSNLPQTKKKRLSGSYTLWLTGPTYGDLDGKPGPGLSLLFHQFATLGYSLSPKWRVSFTQYWTNSIGSGFGTEPNPNFKDPYITLSNYSLAQSEKYQTNLGGYIRYYLPISHEGADSSGQARDQRNGKIQIMLEPAKDFANGLISVSMATFFIKPLRGDKAAPGVRTQRDFYLWTYPKITFNLSEKIQPYIAYSNILIRYIDYSRGESIRWTRFNQAHNFELGFTWFPLPRMLVNPYTEFGPRFVIGDSTIGLIIAYSFL